MQNATRLCVGGMLLLFGAASPVFAQVTILNGDDAPNPPNPPVNSAPNSLIVGGPVNKGETVPNINLDKLLSEQPGAPTTNNADDYVHPPGGGSREVGGAVSGLLDQIW